ncbi:MAG: hypothetical protein QM755_09250 [Luteolibacter sp.]
MKNRSKSKSPLKTRNLTIRLTPEEDVALTNAEKLTGFNRSAITRNAVKRYLPSLLALAEPSPTSPLP